LQAAEKIGEQMLAVIGRAKRVIAVEDIVGNIVGCFGNRL
jgi:hypothetical protein